MLFSQALFLPFLLSTFLLWLPWRATGRKLVLVAASLVFYGAWDLRFLLLLGAVWLVVLLVPQAMARATTPAAGKRWFVGGVAALLLLLFFFKYFDFFLGSLGVEVAGALRILLPVGISFYTFQAISYLVDARRGKLEASRSPLDTALYVTFFPLLLAGPIEKGARWLPQVQQYQPLRWQNIRDGVERMLLGYVMKVGIADTLAPLTNDVFARSGTAGSGELWLGAVAYSLQILTDFAGYSLIARGVAKLFGYEIIHNFEQPYFSRSFTEFWRRWHISLSTWIWDYLFNPLTSFFLRRIAKLDLPDVKQEMRLAYPAAAMTTMLLCGLWHGAGFTFVVWGGLHGLFLSFERLVIFGNKSVARRKPIRNAAQLAKAVLATAVVLLLVTLAWVVFRAASLGEAAVYLQRMFTAGGWVVQPRDLAVLAAALVSTVVIESVLYARRDEWFFRFAGPWRGLVYAAAVMYVIVFGGGSGNVPFIYFQF